MGSTTRGKKRVILLKQYQHLFSLEVGKAVLMNLMQEHYILTSAFDNDPLEMARMEGERNVVLRILAMLKENPQQLIERINEYEENIKSDQIYSDADLED